MKKLVVLILLLITITTINAQISVELSDLGIFSKQSKGSGKVYFNHPSQYNDILKSKIRVEKKAKIWRVRILMVTGNNARDKAEAVRSGFIAKYPGVEASTEYPSPYFKVFVGHFTKRIEAESFRKKISKTYTDTFVESSNMIVSESKKDN